jgi:hypothetical protein
MQEGEGLFPQGASQIEARERVLARLGAYASTRFTHLLCTNHIFHRSLVLRSQLDTIFTVGAFRCPKITFL